MKNIFSKACVALLIAVAATGCLKDKNFENNQYSLAHPDNSPIGVGFPEAKEDLAIYPIAFNSTSQTVGIALVNLLSDQPANQDIQVTLTPNPALVQKYNDSFQANLVAIPPSLYSIPSYVVTIPAGKRTGTLAITIPNAADSLSLTETYGFGFTITSVSGPAQIAANYKDIVVGIIIKNEFDGDYRGSGARVRYNGADVASGIRDSFAISGPITFSTYDATTIVGQLADAGSGFTMALKVTKTANALWDVEVMPDPTSSATPASITQGTPRGANTYNPTTRTFDLHFSYLAGTGALREVNQKLQYIE